MFHIVPAFTAVSQWCSWTLLASETVDPFFSFELFTMLIGISAYIPGYMKYKRLSVAFFIVTVSGSSGNIYAAVTAIVGLV